MAQPNIPPELLAEILRMAGGTVGGYFIGKGNGGIAGGGGDGGGNPVEPADVIYRADADGSGAMRNAWDTWGTDGGYLGRGTADSDLASGLKFAALAGGGYGLSQMLGGAAAGAGAANPGWLSAVPGENAAAITAAGNAMPASASLLPELAGTGAAAGSGLGGAAKTVASALGGSNLGGLLGAALGAAGSKDQEQTSTRDPWAPAQPWIKENIEAGRALQKRLTDEPFSAAQKTAYGNVGGLLNAVNTMAPQMLSGFAANASGANQFSRADPRRALKGSDVGSAGATWNPGLLNFFPGG